MNIRHSSTGNRVLDKAHIEETHLPSVKRSIIANLDLSMLLQSPNNSNSEALRSIRSRLAKVKQESVLPVDVSPKKNSFHLKSTFLDIFPNRNSSATSRNLQLNIYEDPDYPKKHFHRKADKFANHRDAMIRARNLFPMYPR